MQPSCVHFTSSFWAHKDTHTHPIHTRNFSYKFIFGGTFCSIIYRWLLAKVCLCACVRESALKALAVPWDIKCTHNTAQQKVDFNSYKNDECSSFFGFFPHSFCASARVHKVYSMYCMCTVHIEYILRCIIKFSACSRYMKIPAR